MAASYSGGSVPCLRALMAGGPGGALAGDAVNVAARVEGQCHAFGARLLVSEAALALAPPNAEALFLGLVDLAAGQLHAEVPADPAREPDGFYR